MATYTSILKPNSWVTADDFGEWLFDDKPSRYEVPQAGVAASLNLQNIKYTAKTDGVAGNSITIEYTGGATAGSETVALTDQAIVVGIEDGVSTVAQIIAAVDGYSATRALVTPTTIIPEGGDETAILATAQVAVAATNLAGGIDDVPFPKADVPIRRRRYEMLINSACQKIEQIIQTNVLAKDYIDILDGNDSNVVVPSFYPIISITDLRIDFNRQFGPSSVVDELNILLRGMADTRQDVTAPTLRIVGNDIYLRDDDNDNVIGRVFSGSVAGSVRVAYKAGWALNRDDVPSDLKLAALQLAEWYEYRRSNKDVGISSKGVMGQNYSKGEEIIEGIPESIYNMIASYENVSFGTFFRSQNNIFGV